MSNPEKLYEGLPKEMGTTHREEALSTYGKNAVEHSEKELLKLGNKGFKKLKEDLEQVNGELFKLRNEAPQSENVQLVIARHYKAIRAFWGTSKLESSQAEAYAGLGQLYVDDERYTVMNGEPQPAYANFLKKAMAHFADTQLK